MSFRGIPDETQHPWINYDSQLLTEVLTYTTYLRNAFLTSEDTQTLYNDNSSKRHSLAVRIRKALKLDEAEGFDLVDIGMHNYALETAHAPFEFAIVVRPPVIRSTSRS